MRNSIQFTCNQVCCPRNRVKPHWKIHILIHSYNNTRHMLPYVFWNTYGIEISLYIYTHIYCPVWVRNTTWMMENRSVCIRNNIYTIWHLRNDTDHHCADIDHRWLSDSTSRIFCACDLHTQIFFQCTMLLDLWS